MFPTCTLFNISNTIIIRGNFLKNMKKSSVVKFVFAILPLLSFHKYKQKLKKHIKKLVKVRERGLFIIWPIFWHHVHLWLIDYETKPDVFHMDKTAESNMTVTTILIYEYKFDIHNFRWKLFKTLMKQKNTFWTAFIRVFKR